MVRALALLSLALAAPVLAQSRLPSVRPTPAAQQIFDRDWVLMNWALKYYATDRDVLLDAAEAQAAADAFRRMADMDGDGRVTTAEYRAARAFILARY